MEQWRTHPRFTDYEVSDFGRVRRRTAVKGSRPGRMKSPTLSTTGYLIVNIEGKPRKIHTLVLEAFVGPRPGRQDGCHLDGDRTNNVLPNLRWASRSENMRHARLHGTDSRCERHPMAKLTMAQVQEIRRRHAAGTLQRELAAAFGVSRAHISYLVLKGWVL